MDRLIKPYGGNLQNLLIDDARASRLKADSQGFPSVTLTQRQLCDLELLNESACFWLLTDMVVDELYALRSGSFHNLCFVESRFCRCCMR